MTTHRRRHLWPGVLFAFLTPLPIAAQCAQWVPGDGFPGVTGPVGPFPANVAAMTWWDADGSGPGPVRLVIGGNFTLAGSAAANHIVLYDPTNGEWSALGAGTNGPVLALATLANGELVAGGDFTQAGGLSANYIARWNGSTWSNFATGMDGRVASLATMPNGDLVAGGFFYTAGGTTVNSIARWNGVLWSPLVTGPVTIGIDGPVRCLLLRPNGDLIAGGAFSTVGGFFMPNIARFDGTTWSPMMGLNGHVLCLATLANGDLIAGGRFTDRLRRWNGTSWVLLGGAFDEAVLAALTLPNGDLVATGEFFVAGGATAIRIARWNGTAWAAMGAGLVGSGGPFGAALAVQPGGGLFVGGQFETASGARAHSVARFQTGAWSALARGANGPIQCQVRLPNGDLVGAGAFTTIGGVNAAGIARRSGSTWSPLGAGTDGLVRALAVMPNGDVVAGGGFNLAGGVPGHNIARWNGSAWAALGSGVNPTAYALTPLPNGDLVAGGAFVVAGGVSVNFIARWNGTAWSPVGSGTGGPVHALTTLPNGDVIVGGSFFTAGGIWVNSIARWNGANWSALGSGLGTGLSMTTVWCVTTAGNGDLIAGGEFAVGGANNIARWNGTQWLPLGPGLNGPVVSVARLPNGDLVVAGSFTAAGGVGASRIARWNGSQWLPLAAGTNNAVQSLCAVADGEVAVAGDFTVADGRVSPYLARYVSTCPASSVVHGSGCAGAGGPNVLVATSLPWLGSTFRSLATGLTVDSLAASVYGFTTLALPMPMVHQAGLPGCTLLVADDILLEFTRGSGSVASQLAIPAQPALVGGVFHHQVVPVELDALGHIAALTSTNALALTIGAYQ